jgi:anti-anti-sigma factor
MNLTSSSADGVPMISVGGEVDMSNAHEIEQLVRVMVGNDALALLLDLSDVTYLDSSGIRLLFQLDARLGAHQQRLVVVVPGGAVILRTLQAAGVIGSLLLASSVDAALVIARAERDSNIDRRGPIPS